MEREDIDGCRRFDWSDASADYAKYRDIYPPAFYQYLRAQGIGKRGQRLLDLGTGTGVLPRSLYPCGAKFVGVDSAEGQIAQARALAERAGMEIDFLCLPAERIRFAAGSFDGATACQCLMYFDHAALAPRLARVLKEGGFFAILYMAWLPEEDEVARQSEELVLRYNPRWTGGGEVRRPIQVPREYGAQFELERSDLFDLQVPFTRESWNGRMKACRGIGASLSVREAQAFEREHLALLERVAPPEFTVRHYAAAAILRKR